MKEDQEYIHSGGHPDLTSATAPRTTMTSFTKGKGLPAAMKKREQEESKKRKKRTASYELS